MTKKREERKVGYKGNRNDVSQSCCRAWLRPGWKRREATEEQKEEDEEQVELLMEGQGERGGRGEDMQADVRRARGLPKVVKLWYCVVTFELLGGVIGNGTRRTVDVKNQGPEEILRQAQRLRSSVGRKASLTIKNPVVSPGDLGGIRESGGKGRSIQGGWRPGMFDAVA